LTSLAGWVSPTNGRPSFAGDLRYCWNPTPEGLDAIPRAAARPGLIGLARPGTPLAQACCLSRAVAIREPPCPVFTVSGTSEKRPNAGEGGWAGE
jgi:hypothetical protein